eukprot:scaffold6497_cov159-Isochrysis_galbana.AAC.2
MSRLPVAAHKSPSAHHAGVETKRVSVAAQGQSGAGHTIKSSCEVTSFILKMRRLKDGGLRFPAQQNAGRVS